MVCAWENKGVSFVRDACHVMNLQDLNSVYDYSKTLYLLNVRTCEKIGITGCFITPSPHARVCLSPN